MDGALVPGLLLLVARELALYDPPRELAWQLFHELKDTPKPAWLTLFLPRPYPTLFDDPVGLALATIATGLAAAYALAALTGARPRARAAILGLAAFVLIALPTAAVIALGVATGRPYGHDGGVVQLPLALDRILAGQSPYGADYSNSILGWQSRSSVFWAPLGGNPIIHHHWYLPGMDLVMLPAYLLARGIFGYFDARLVTFAGFLAAVLLAPRLVEGAEARLAAAALFAVSPFVFWHQIFGTNDVLSAVPLLLAALLAARGRRDAAAVMVGVAASIKQLTWPFVPFFLVHLAGLESFGAIWTRRGLARLARPAAIVGGVLVAVVAPLAALDLHAFIADIFRYQVGSPGSEQYPLGGTPGFGIANLLIYTGRVRSLGEYFPFQRFYLLFIPIGLLLLKHQLRERTLGSVFVAGSAALLTSVYLSRIVNPNYVVLAALLLPLGMLMDRRLSADVALVPLLAFLLATEISLRGVLQTTWADAQAWGAGLGLPGWLQPDPAGPRWRDPLSTGLSGLLAGLGLVYLLAAVAGLRQRGRRAILAGAAVVAIVVPTYVVAHVGIEAGLRRAQDRWYVEVLRSREAPGPGAWADRPGYRPTPVVEAWSTSWRRDPPRPIAEAQPSPLAFALGRSMRGLGLQDPRVFSVLAALIAALCAAALVRREDDAALIAVLLLAPASAIGVVVGSGAAVVLAFVLVAWVAARRSALAGGVLLGAATAARPEAVLLAPLAIRSTPFVAVAALVVGSAVVSLPLAAPFGGELLRWAFGTPALAPGIGLSNLLYYRPVDPVPILRAWRIAAPLALVCLAAILIRSERGRARPLATAGVLWTVALFVLPGMPAHAAAIPIVLLTAGALEARAVSTSRLRSPSR
jgi:Glycosyltransferase family 87